MLVLTQTQNMPPRSQPARPQKDQRDARQASDSVQQDNMVSPHASAHDCSWGAINSSKLDVMLANQEQLKTEVGKHSKQLGSIQNDLTNITGALNSVQSDVSDLQKENSELRYLVTALLGRENRLEERMSRMENAITDIRARSMQQNILIHNSKISVENPKEDLWLFLLQDLAMTKEDIEEVEPWVGRVHPVSKTAGSPIIVQFLKQDAMQKVLDHRRKLSGNVRISVQAPPEVREERKKYEKDIEAAIDQKKKFHFVQDTLYVANTKVKPLSRPAPKVRDLGAYGAQPKPYKASNKFNEKGNVFGAFAATIDSVEDVGPLVDFISATDAVGANHVVYAYYVSNTVHGYFDDAEHGAGRTLLKTIKERNEIGCVVIMARWMGAHLGNQRFQWFEKAAVAALDKL